MEDNRIGKKRLAIAGAVAFGFSAICTGSAVSYYAAVVVQDFYMSGGMTSVGLGAQGGLSSTGLGNRYVYGAALFIGWGSLFLGVVGMILQICGSRGDDEEDDYGANYNTGKRI